MLRVFKDHRLLDEWPSRCRAILVEVERELAPEDPADAAHDLVVYDGKREVHRYPHGTWDASGEGIVCGYQAPLQEGDCPNCTLVPEEVPG